MKKRIKKSVKLKSKDDFLIRISAGILLMIIAMTGFYLKISPAERESELKGTIGELYSGGANQPSVSMMVPQFIEAYPQTKFNLSVSYSDADGINDLNYVRLIINKGSGNYPNYTARIDYFPSTDKISIYDYGEENNLMAHYSFEENLN